MSYRCKVGKCNAVVGKNIKKMTIIKYRTVVMENNRSRLEIEREIDACPDCYQNWKKQVELAKMSSGL